MNWQAGDIAACYGTDRASRLISWGTASLFGPRSLRVGPSHVAILAPPPSHDGLVWVESTTFCPRPCMLNQVRTAGCQVHEPEDRVADYESTGGRVDWYRLTPIREFSRSESVLLSRILFCHFVSRRVTYDMRGALLSGSRVWQMLRSFPGADLNSLFCSELVAAVLQRLGRLNNSNPARYNPARLLRELVTSGVYQRIDRPALKIAEGTRHAA